MDDTQMDPIVDATEGAEEVSEEAAMVDEQEVADDAVETDEEIA